MKKTLLMAAAAIALLLPATLPAGSSPRSGEAGYSPARHRRPSHRFRGHWGFSSYWGWGYPYYGYGYGPYGGYYGHYRRGPYGYAPSRDWAAIDTDVSPESARVYLDGTLIGTADDFDGHPDFLYLKRGRYALEFRLEGYESRKIDVSARPGMTLQIDEKLGKIPGAKQYGSYEAAEPEGGVRRFWGKRSDRAESVEDEEEIYGARPERRERDRDEDAEEEDEEEADSRPSARERREDWREDRRSRESEEPSQSAARLRLRVEPADAAIYLDDRFVGTAEEINSLGRGIAVSVGKHRVTVSRPGYADRTVDVEVVAGESEELEIELKR